MAFLCCAVLEPGQYNEVVGLRIHSSDSTTIRTMSDLVLSSDLREVWLADCARVPFPE